MSLIDPGAHCPCCDVWPYRGETDPVDPTGCCRDGQSPQTTAERIDELFVEEVEMREPLEGSS